METPNAESLQPDMIRATYTRIAYGQLRDYGPRVDHFRVFIETTGWKRPVRGWEPCLWHEDLVKQLVRGYSPWTPEGEGDWASTRLKWAKNIGPGTWEFYVETPSTH